MQRTIFGPTAWQSVDHLRRMQGKLADRWPFAFFTVHGPQGDALGWANCWAVGPKIHICPQKEVQMTRNMKHQAWAAEND